MSEWLDIMLDEVARKRREREAAIAELERRRDESDVQDSESAGSEGK